MFSRALTRVGGECILSFDVLSKWYANSSKPIGFLARELGPKGVPVHFVQGTCAEIPSRLKMGSVGGAFIDASHYHPWATIDTIILMPLMEVGGFIGHHDLDLYMHTEYANQLGPKYLFDQLPRAITVKDKEEPFSPSFIINVPNNYKELTNNVLEALSLPWSSNQEEIYDDQRIEKFIESTRGLCLSQKLRRPRDMPIHKSTQSASGTTQS